VQKQSISSYVVFRRGRLDGGEAEILLRLEDAETKEKKNAS
jgi:hypothetical protein